MIKKPQQYSSLNVIGKSMLNELPNEINRLSSNRVTILYNYGLHLR